MKTMWQVEVRATWVTTLARRIGCGVALTTVLSSVAIASGTCDPTISSCVPGSGGGSTCSPMSASLGLCTPGSGGGGGGGGGGGVCTAPPGGSPTCSGSGAATQGGGSTPSSGAGNPINILNGNKYQEETDLAPLPGVLGLELKRYYNSQSTHPGLLGANWRMSYETVLYDLGSEIQIVQADGRRLMFQRGIGQSATLCSSPQPQDGQVRIEPAKDGKGQPTYYWRWADGRTLMFSSGSGGGYPLQSITAATGERVTLNYSPTGEITSIRDPQGRQLVFIYASAAEKRSRALKAIDTPLGRLTYSQDALGRLTEVGQAKDATSAPFLSRLYHYEDRYSAGHPQALTGISVRGPDPQTHQITEQRLSTYVYNAAGLAILSTKGRPREMKDGKQVADTGIEQVEVAYLDKPLPQDVKVDRKTGEATPTRLGKAILTNSLGQTTQVTSALIAGHFRLMEMRGPGCSTCGPGNMRYAYDAQGLLIRSTKLDDNGAPVRAEVTELDKYGRTARVGVQNYAGAKAQATRWTQRFEYPDVHYPDGSVAVAPQPSLIGSPSVVAGKEHVLRFDYNEAGQPLTLTEQGFSPIDERGQLAPAGSPFTRTTTYRYAKVATRTVLSEIDGPLPNGPSNSPVDSDITRLEWNALGTHVAAIVQPGGRRVELAADDVGRWSRALFIDGRSRVQVDARYDGAVTTTRMPSAMTQAAWLVDGSGAPVADTRRSSELGVARDGRGALDGVHVDSAAWGRDLVQEVRAALDVQRQHALNPGEAERASVSFKTEQDASGRPVAWSESTDREPVLSADWGPVGSAAEATVLSLSTSHVRALRLLDDTGQVVAIRNPGQQWQTARRDAAGRIVELRDPRGARAVASWDASSRLVSLKRYAPNSEAIEQTVSRRYDAGALNEELIEDGFGRRRTITRRDALGRILSETTRIEPTGELAAAIHPVETTVAYRYATNGQLTGRTLVSDSGDEVAIDQSLDADGRLVAMSTPGWLPRWLGGGRDIVNHIGWQRFAALDWATTIEHGDATKDSYDELGLSGGGSVEEPSTAHPVHVSLPADAGWQPPGRDADASGLPAAIETSRGAQRLRWNAASQLIETTRADGSNSRYVYDARGRRVLKLTRDADGRTVATLALYEDSRLLAEADAKGSLTHAYAWIGERPVAQLLIAQQGGWAALKARLFGAPVLALHTDRAGQVVSMSDAGREVWTQRSSTGGRTSASILQVALHQPLRYVGQYHDDESGLDYHGARFYEPGIGRFVSPDPSGIADAVNEVGHPRLLDLYAYAAGRPDDYLDPTGAARIRYYAITTGAGGGALGTSQGFTKARWAFVVDDVQAPTSASDNATLDQLQQKYASQGTGVLYDAHGDYLSGGTETAIWQGASASDLNAFTSHYGDNLVSIPQFTVQMNDADAARLIASYISADALQLNGAGTCPLRAQLLPDIKFAAEEVPIKVTSASYSAPGGGTVLAQSQRIMACGSASDTDVIQRRIQKYNDAAMLLESSPGQIYKDCHTDGCPGHSLDSTVLSGYVASYGQTQFIGTTMVSTLRGMKSNVTDATTRSTLQLDDTALWADVTQQNTRALYVESVFRAHNATTPDWAHTPAAQQTDFLNRSGLDATAAASTWNDMNRWHQHPTANLNGEAAAAFGTKILMAKADVKDYLMGIFKDSAPGGKFNVVSLQLMRTSYDAVIGQVDQTNSVAATLADGTANPAWAARQREIEIDVGMRTARKHNGDYNGKAVSGTFAQVVAEDSATAGRQYAHRFINAPEYPVVQPADPRHQQPTADYFSLRCTATIASPKVPRGGLIMTPLQIH